MTVGIRRKTGITASERPDHGSGELRCTGSLQ